MWKVSVDGIVGVYVCMYIPCACIHTILICLRVSDGGVFLGVVPEGWTWGSGCWRSDMMQQCSEWAPPACAPAAAWILFCYTKRGCLSGLLCLCVLHLSNIKEQKAIFRQVGNDEKHSLVWLNCCGHKCSFTVDNMIVFSFSIIVCFVFLF